MGLIKVEGQLIHDATVFVAHGGYQIIFNTRDKGLAWVKVGDNVYSDDNNGNINSEKTVHKIFVDKDELDSAKEYTIRFARCIDRKPYFAESGETFEKTYSFKPMNKDDDINIYMICDSHSRTAEPAHSGKYFGDELDALVLNGDIPNHSGGIDHLLSVHYITSKITEGRVPVIYARGNHDTRGRMAIDFADYVATDNGNLYYTFRIGSIWGVVLDCGEDKNDDHPEYGGMANFDAYRAAQTRFLKNIIKNKSSEYAADDVKYKIAICHVRMDLYKDEYFTRHYKEWLNALNEIGVDVMLNGHEHRRNYLPAGRETELGTIGYHTVLGGSFDRRDLPDGTKIRNMNGTALTFNNNKIDVVFTDGTYEKLEEHIIDIDK